MERSFPAESNSKYQDYVLAINHISGEAGEPGLYLRTKVVAKEGMSLFNEGDDLCLAGCKRKFVADSAFKLLGIPYGMLPHK